MASEVGVVDIAPDQIAHKGRLSPGNIFLVDFAEGRVIADQEVMLSLLLMHLFSVHASCSVACTYTSACTA